MGKIVYGFMQINFIFRCYLKYKNIYFQKKKRVKLEGNNNKQKMKVLSSENAPTIVGKNIDERKTIN